MKKKHKDINPWSHKLWDTGESYQFFSVVDKIRNLSKNPPIHLITIKSTCCANLDDEEIWNTMFTTRKSQSLSTSKRKYSKWAWRHDITTCNNKKKHCDISYKELFKSSKILKRQETCIAKSDIN